MIGVDWGGTHLPCLCLSDNGRAVGVGERGDSPELLVGVLNLSTVYGCFSLYLFVCEQFFKLLWFSERGCRVMQFCTLFRFEFLCQNVVMVQYSSFATAFAKKDLLQMLA